MTNKPPTMNPQPRFRVQGPQHCLLLLPELAFVSSLSLIIITAYVFLMKSCITFFLLPHNLVPPMPLSPRNSSAVGYFGGYRMSSMNTTFQVEDTPLHRELRPLPRTWTKAPHELLSISGLLRDYHGWT